MPAENIFAAYAQPVRSMADYADELDQRQLRGLQLQGQQRQNAIADLTAQQTQDTLRQTGMEREALRRAAQAAGGDRRKFAALLRAEGMPGLLAAAATEEAALQKQAESDSKIAKEAADTAEDRRKTLTQAQRDAYADAAALNTPEDAAQYMNMAVRQGKIPMQMAQGVIRMVQSDPLWKLKLLQGSLDADKLKEALMPHMVNAGGAFQNTNPIAVGAAPIPITQSADNAATQTTAIRGQNMTAGTAAQRLALDATKTGENAPPKPLPSTALKLQNEALAALGGFKNVDADLEALEQQIADGTLEVGPVARAGAFVRGNINRSNQNDRNLSSLQTKLEGMRNQILLLGKGVQTEGDAQRAMDEIIKNLNDQELLKQRIPELRAKVKRDADLQKAQVDLLLSNYGRPPMDFSKFDPRPASVNLPKPGAANSGTDLGGGFRVK